MKNEVIPGKNDIHAKLGDNAPASSTVHQQLAAEFKRGRKSLEDGPRFGHPAKSTNPTKPLNVFTKWSWETDV